MIKTFNCRACNAYLSEENIEFFNYTEMPKEPHLIDMASIIIECHHCFTEEEMETTFHGLWRAPRDLKEMLRGLKDITQNYMDYRQRSLNTAQELSWFNRSKELINLFNNHI